MYRIPAPAALVATLALAACGTEDPARTPTAPNPATLSGTLSVSAETRQLEGITRRFALALNDPGFRARLYQRLATSPYPEGKIQLQRTLDETGRGEFHALAKLNRESEAVTDSVLRVTRALEVYLPEPMHRRQWKGDGKLLVATQARDGELPVAFDLKGGRHFLDPTRPPLTPVLAVVPVETNFDRPPVRGAVTCLPGDTSCGGGGGGGYISAAGLYMTKAHFNSDFEGWLKGSPEFEIHVMGQRGHTDSLVKYQCAGEHQGGAYYWDGDTDWTGSVMLFSSTEIANYKAAHPGEVFRLVAMEDDDTSCEMKIDPNRWATFVGTIGPLYNDITGAVDTGGVKKYVAAAKGLRKFLSSLASWIKSNDDLIGNAMEDKVVNEYHTGFNWILRADNNVTNGWINLQMK
ncbi:MAG: hypothetical protein ABI742_04500 [Gemmatimonadota bacterium]